MYVSKAAWSAGGKPALVVGMGADALAGALPVRSNHIGTRDDASPLVPGFG
jgi:hypothetical protein